MLQIDDISVDSELDLRRTQSIRVSSYYMNNREIFVNFMSSSTLQRKLRKMPKLRHAKKMIMLDSRLCLTKR